MGFFDQAAQPQHPKMAAHGRRRQLQDMRELPRTPRSLAQQVDRSPPVGIRQRRERAVEVC